MRILLTGGKGYLASYLNSFLLQHGHSVLNVSRSTEITLEDVLDTSETFDIYIHTAGLSSDTPFSDTEVYEQSNFVLSKKLLKRFQLDKKAKGFIFLSTLYTKLETVYKTPYALSKTNVEQFIFNQNDYRIKIVRPALICSPPVARGILGPIQKLAKSGLILKFPPKYHMQWVSIETIGQSILEIIMNKEGATELDLIDFDANLNEPRLWLMDFMPIKKGLTIYLPNWVIQLLFNLGHFLKLPLNKHFLNKLTL